MLALDPPGDPTIGACIAGDLSGPRRHRYGRMRDLVLGVTVVLGDGIVASSGGKVVKNVAGYDLGKLLLRLAGHGWASIAARSLRLHPLPDASATLVAPGRRRPRTERPSGRRSCARRSSPQRARPALAGRLARAVRGRRARPSSSSHARARRRREDGSVWDEVEARQAAQGGCVRPGELADARGSTASCVPPASRTSEPVPTRATRESRSPSASAQQFDPRGAR